MRTLTRMLLSVLLLSAAMGSAMADTKDYVATAYRAWDAAFNSGNAKAVAALYAPDANLLLLSGRTVLTGPAEIEKLFASAIAKGIKNHRLKVTEAVVAGNAVYSTAKWSATDKDGKALGGIATLIFERQADGSWKLDSHTFDFD